MLLLCRDPKRVAELLLEAQPKLPDEHSMLPSQAEGIDDTCRALASKRGVQSLSPFDNSLLRLLRKLDPDTQLRWAALACWASRGCFVGCLLLLHRAEQPRPSQMPCPWLNDGSVWRVAAPPGPASKAGGSRCLYMCPGAPGAAAGAAS